MNIEPYCKELATRIDRKFHELEFLSYNDYRKGRITRDEYDCTTNKLLSDREIQAIEVFSSLSSENQIAFYLHGTFQSILWPLLDPVQRSAVIILQDTLVLPMSVNVDE